MNNKLRTPLIFETIFSQYTASSILGEGGSGQVFEAVDETKQHYAIKVLNPDKATREKTKRFKNELLFGFKNNHPNIVTILDFGRQSFGKKSTPYYVMPLYPQSLRDLIEAKISIDKVLIYFGQLLDGIEAAHLKKVIHRDIKPENILYDPGKDCLLVADFGIARFSEEELYTLVETAPGTRLANFQYAAPEQRSRGHEVDHRADIYAIGLILNELFTGEVPLGTGYRTIESVAPQFVYLDEIVSTMLRQSPSDRPASIDAIKQQLIARENEFITRQKISELRDTVVPASQIDDPFVVDPVRLTGCDWDKNILTLQLSRPVNEKWKAAFLNIDSRYYLYGKSPENFQFMGDKAIINASDSQVQKVIDQFNGWLPVVNQKYEQIVIKEMREKENRERERIKKELEDQERRQSVLRNVKI
jgi:serine/threonine protein kinase